VESSHQLVSDSARVAQPEQSIRHHSEPGCLSGRRLTREEQLTLASWARFDELPSLEGLAEGFPPHGTGRAYLVALSVVSWLDAQQVGGARRLVAALEQGQSLEDALRAASGRGLVQVERDWRAAVAAEYSLGEGLLRSVTVWSIIGLLALLAILRHLVLRRRRLRLLASEEALPCEESPPGDTVDSERGGVDGR